LIRQLLLFDRIDQAVNLEQQHVGSLSLSQRRAKQSQGKTTAKEGD